MVRAHEWSKKVGESLAEAAHQLFPPREDGIKLEETLITPKQFHAIRGQIVANIAFRSGIGDLQQKNEADGEVVEAFGGMENPNMGMINLTGHLAEHVALDVADMFRNRNEAETHPDTPEAGVENAM